MKQGWEVKKLGEVCTILMGQSPSSDTYNDLGEGLPFFQGNADFGRVHPSVRVYCNAPIRIADVDDILISVRAPIGAINITNTKCCIGRGLAAIKNGNRIKKSFAYHALIANKDKLIALGTGSTFKSIGRIALNDLLIPVPPIDEQENIVAELDCLSGIIEKKKQQLKEYDALAQSIFYEMFGNPIDNEKGWEVKTLGEIAYIGLGFTHTPQYVEQGVAFLSVKDISKGEINWDNVKYVSLEEYDSAPKGSKPNKGDIMFCRVGTMGKPIIVDTDIPFCTFVSLGYLHLLDSNIINTYVKYWMLSFAFDAQVEANVKGVAIKNLNTGWLKNFKIQIPILSLQQEFASKIEAIEKQKELIKQSIVETETLFNSRMDYYFN